MIQIRFKEYYSKATKVVDNLPEFPRVIAYGEIFEVQKDREDGQVLLKSRVGEEFLVPKDEYERLKMLSFAHHI